jgi:hypothetical protein
VSEKPVFAGSAPPIVGQMDQAREQALTRGVDGRALAEFLGSRGEGIPAAISPFEEAVPADRALPIETSVGPSPLSLPEEMPFDPDRYISPELAAPVEALTPLPEEPYYVPEPAYLDAYNPYAAALPYERMNRYAGGGAIGDDFNFGFAHGGMPEYKAGGKLLDGPGDGMSDSIPAVIRGKGVQRAALADGEFVIPADVVSHLGNGSTKAGAKKLYQMMAQVRKARTGKTKQAPAVKTDRLLPA